MPHVTMITNDSAYFDLNPAGTVFPLPMNLGIPASAKICCFFLHRMQFLLVLLLLLFWL